MKKGPVLPRKRRAFSFGRYGTSGKQATNVLHQSVVDIDIG
jgi:hypothetical protein